MHFKDSQADQQWPPATRTGRRLSAGVVLLRCGCFIFLVRNLSDDLPMTFPDIDYGTWVYGRSSNACWLELSCNAIADPGYSHSSRNGILVFNHQSLPPNALWRYLHELIISPALPKSAGKTAFIEASFRSKVLGWDSVFPTLFRMATFGQFQCIQNFSHSIHFSSLYSCIPFYLNLGKK